MSSWFIAAHEWRRLFSAPLAWLCLGLVQLLSAVVFVILLTEFASMTTSEHSGVALFIGGGLSGFCSIVFLLIVPLLSMRSIAEERNHGSFELLMSAPVTATAIILGKYLGLLGFCLLMLLPTALMPASLAVGTDLDWGLLVANWLAIALLVASFAAICLLISSLSSQPAVVALSGFGLLLLLWLAQAAASGHGLLMNTLEYISPIMHLDALRRGLLDTADLTYFLITIASCISLAIIALKWQFARRRAGSSLLSGFLVLCITIQLAILSQWHMAEFDLSFSGRNSLQAPSRAILQAMPQAILATAWLDADLQDRQQIKARFAPYLAAKTNFQLRFRDPASDPETVRELGISAQGEVLIEYQGRKQIIDSLSEPDISAALQRLNQPERKRIVFATGHGERGISDDGQAGYSKLAQALASKGLQVTEQNLILQPLPASTSLLVLAAAQSAYLPAELQQINSYLDSGAALLLLFDPDTPAPNSLLGVLGLQAMSGAQVFPDYQDIGSAHPALAVQANYPPHPASSRLDQITAFPIAGGLITSANSGWQHRLLLQSDQRSWLEFGDLQGELSFDAETEVAGPISFGFSAERGAQRVISIADSDFMANAYLEQLGNRALALALFSWLLDTDETLAIDLPAAPDAQLILQAWQSRAIAIVFLLLIPGSMLIIALIQYLRRRQR